MIGRKRLLVTTWAGIVAAGGIGAATLQALGAPDTEASSASADATPSVSSQAPMAQSPAIQGNGGTVTVHGSAPPMPAPPPGSAGAGTSSLAQSGHISAGPLQGPLGAAGSGAACCPCAPVRHVVHHVRRHVVRRPTVVASLPPPPLVPYRPVYVYRPLVAYRPVVPLVPVYRPVYPVVVARPFFHRAWW